jgi:hypothetical protein
MKVFISLKRDFEKEILRCSTCLGLVEHEQPKYVRTVIIYLVEGENDTTGHFGRSVEQVWEVLRGGSIPLRGGSPSHLSTAVVTLQEGWRTSHIQNGW